MKKELQTFGLLCFLLCSGTLYGQTMIVRNSAAKVSTDFTLAGKTMQAPIVIDSLDFPAVKLAADFLAEDIRKVTGRKPKVSNSTKNGPQLIIAGTIGNSKLIDGLIASGKITTSKIKGHWEATMWQLVANPMPGVKKALIIAGSDRRGTAYGLLQLSKLMGVSPWEWWADVPVKKQQMLTLSLAATKIDEPAIKYRGIFINDEDWGINEWARKNFEKEFGEGVGPKTYEKVFELMLRLRLNYFWPAMHEVSKEFGDTPANVELADKYAIVAGSSHCEPMLYNNVHWKENLRGAWNYSTNRDTIYKIWENTAIFRKDKEAVWTMGIRGIHDRGMETPPTRITDRIDVLQKVFRDQRNIINQYVTKQFGPVAQCFVPYKEVLPIYDAGLKVPDDVTLIWVDDNFGYIRRLSNPEERKRDGGSGLYWHLSYYGYPHSYTWINTTAPALMWEEFHKAWENQARRMWVINVGDIKPMELGIDYFSRLAWNPEKQQANTQPQFLSAFATEHFNRQSAPAIAELLTAYYRLGTVRKPELMNREWALSLSGREAQALQADYEHMMQMNANTLSILPRDQQDAYTEMIGFPSDVLAISGLIFLHDRAAILTSDKQIHEAAITALRSKLQNNIDNFNNKIAGGKWQYMMPGMVTAKKLLAWNSQVAWPWAETRQPDTTKKALQVDYIRAAASADRQSSSGKTKWTLVPGLGQSGKAMVLKPVNITQIWDEQDLSAPTLFYNFEGSEISKAILDFMPTFRVYPGMRLRVAVGIDGKYLSTIEVPGSDGKEDENGVNRNQGIRNNFVSAVVNLPPTSKGKHRFFVRAVDPGVVLDKISFSKSN
ncbi:glycosyl hydrolase 115 family protein [Pedobacter sp. BG31]|uniref:glycosyl hydrolase 115 family protein n=1 Tax=Pedobacter sp. BG31 TaxID=3349697 RepID=UPI0035F2B8E2